jgi:hypothetical protein
MAKSNRTEGTDITRPAVRKDFWEFLISRHPVEEEHAKSTRRPYRWARNIRRHHLVVVQFVSGRGIGVFVRASQ